MAEPNHSVPRRACSVADIPETGVLGVLVDGVPVAIVRDSGGNLHAVGDTCSHADVSLSEGEVEGCTLECWLHGSRFDLRTGHPLSLPATDPIPVFPLNLDGDDILVDVSVSAAKEN